MKRKRPSDVADSPTPAESEPETPRKSSRRVTKTERAQFNSEHQETGVVGTPSKSILKTKDVPDLLQNGHTPKKTAHFASPTVATPAKSKARAIEDNTIADHSARRKSSRLLIRQAQAGQDSDAEDSQDELLAEEIFEEEEEDQEVGASYSGVDAQSEDPQQEDLLPETPTKRPRGRRKAQTKQRTPSPPPDLPSYEQYFFQNRPGGAKASDNTLPASALISHEDYYEAMQAYVDPHESELDFLHALHSRSFDQWCFELEQGFSICVYGWGSKRELLLDFAAHVSQLPDSTVVVINGFNVSTSLRDICSTLASTIPALASSNQKLGSQPADMLTTVLRALDVEPLRRPITLVLHSIDGASLRRGATQSLLGRLASHPSIQLIASADTPNFPLLWDSSLRTQFNWVFHDCTTFQSFDAEISGGAAGAVVDEVNALLGRSGRKMHGREGVMYVLKSLTQSARSLFGLLVAELLSLDETDEGANTMIDGMEDEEDDFEDAVTPLKPKVRDKSKQRPAAGGGLNAAIEWRSLYQKAVSQFIATNEMSFRGLLKEFHDHEMVVSRKDAMGTEVLSVPFRREELETLLEELVGET